MLPPRIAYPRVPYRDQKPALTSRSALAGSVLQGCCLATQRERFSHTDTWLIQSMSLQSRHITAEVIKVDKIMDKIFILLVEGGGGGGGRVLVCAYHACILL